MKRLFLLILTLTLSLQAGKHSNGTGRSSTQAARGKPKNTDPLTRDTRRRELYAEKHRPKNDACGDCIIRAAHCLCCVPLLLRNLLCPKT